LSGGTARSREGYPRQLPEHRFRAADTFVAHSIGCGTNLG
jgi:hypothetical protein